MTEQAPSGLSALEKERARLASERAKLEHKENVLNGEELFGKFDNGVTPAEGEMTYQQYLEQRPAEGVIHNGRVYQDAQSNKFVSPAKYEAQKAANLVDDKTVEAAIRSNEGKQFESPYENMGVMQLAKEAAKARIAGNRTLDEDIREVAERYLTNDAIKVTNDSESPEEAQARYDSDIARYDSLVERFVNLSAAAKIDKVIPEPVVEATPAESAPVEVSNAELEPKALAEVLYNGEKVTVENVFQSPDGKKAVQIVDAEGKTRLVFEEELTYVEPVEEAPEETPVEKAEPAEQEPNDPAEGKEVVTVVGTEVKSIDVPEEDEAKEVEKAEEATRLEQIKNWFKKERSHIQELAGYRYMGKLWERAKSGRNNVLNVGVTEAMSDDEKEHKRKSNRSKFLIGVAGLTVLAVGAVGLAAHDGSGGQEETHSASSEQSQTVSDPLRDILNPADTGFSAAGGETAAPVTTPEATAIPAEAFNIPGGSGGLELFDGLNVDSAKWYANEDSLLSQFPTDFYRMSDGHVGIAHSGMLSQGAQDFIESLK